MSRMAAVIVAVGAAEGVFVWFAPRPMPWVVMIPALIPLLTVVFVIIPMQKAETR